MAFAATSAGTPTVNLWSQPYRHMAALQTGRNIHQLAQALQSGDLGAAQSAYSNLTWRNVGSRSTNSTLDQDISALGEKLQAGDLSGAQTAFATLQQDFQTAVSVRKGNPQGIARSTQNAAAEDDAQAVTHTHHPHRHHSQPTQGASSGAQQITINVGESDAGGDQITLNLEGNGQSAEQVTINFSGGNSSSAPEQVTLNLGGGNETITLNFADSASGAASNPAASTTTPGSTPGRTVNVTA